MGNVHNLIENYPLLGEVKFLDAVDHIKIGRIGRPWLITQSVEGLSENFLFIQEDGEEVLKKVGCPVQYLNEHGRPPVRAGLTLEKTSAEIVLHYYKPPKGFTVGQFLQRFP